MQTTRLHRSLPIAVLQSLLVVAAYHASAEQHAEGLELVGRTPYPHCWHAQFVKKGNHLFVTGNETANKLKVVDVSDPANMKVVATSEVCGHNASNTIRVHNDLLLINCYRFIVPVDVSDPLKPKVLVGCEWAPDGLAFDAARVWGYSYAWHKDALFLFGKKLRVYSVEKTFKPRLTATLDLSERGGAGGGPLVGDVFHFVSGGRVVKVDVSRPTEPKVCGTIGLGEPVRGLGIAGNTFFMLGDAPQAEQPKKKEPGRVVVAFDVNDPKAPRKLGHYEGVKRPAHLAIHNKTLYVIGAEEVPKDEREVDGVSLGRAGHWFRYRTVLEAVDISDPSRMSRKARYQFPCTG